MTPPTIRAKPPTAAPAPMPILAPVDSDSAAAALLVAPAMMYVGWGSVPCDGIREGGGTAASRVKALNEGPIVGALSCNSPSVSVTALGRINGGSSGGGVDEDDDDATDKLKKRELIDGASAAPGRSRRKKTFDSERSNWKICGTQSNWVKAIGVRLSG